MARIVIAVLLLALGLSLCAGSRDLLSDDKSTLCQCGPYVDTRTPDEICSQKHEGLLCNSGGYFPVLTSNCTTFFTCDNGKADFVTCPLGTVFDVTANTCVHKSLQINGKEVCSNKCLGFLYKPLDGCYHVGNTNTGKGAWGLYNTGEYAVGCGNSGTAASGVANNGGYAAGCQNSGTAAWGFSNSGGGSCGKGVTDTNILSP